MGNQQETPTIDEEAEQHRIDQRFIDAGWLPSWEVVDRLFEKDPDQFLELMSTMRDWVDTMHGRAQDHIEISRRGPIRGKRLVLDYATKAGLGLRKIA